MYFCMRLCEGDVQGARGMDCKVVLVVVPNAAVTRAVECSQGPRRPSRGSRPSLGNLAGWVHREASGCLGTQDRAFPKWEKTFWAPHVQGCQIGTAGAVLDWDGIIGRMGPSCQRPSRSPKKPRRGQWERRCRERLTHCTQRQSPVCLDSTFPGLQPPLKGSPSKIQPPRSCPPCSQ